MVDNALRQAAKGCIDDFRVKVKAYKAENKLKNRQLAAEVDVEVNTIQTFLAGGYPNGVTLKMISLGLGIPY